MSLRSTILEQFVCHTEVDRVRKSSAWNNELEDWEYTRPDYKDILQMPPPKSINSERPYPLTEFARTAWILGDKNPRYRYCNTYEPELELPQRTTLDWMNLSKPKFNQLLFLRSHR
eukprot:UN03641